MFFKAALQSPNLTIAPRLCTFSGVQAVRAQTQLPALKSFQKTNSSQAKKVDRGLLPRDCLLNQTFAMFEGDEAQIKTIGALLFITQSRCAEANEAAGASAGIFDHLDSASVAQFLLGNPLLIAGISVALIYAIPRVVGMTVRFVLVPVVCILITLLIVENPETITAAFPVLFDAIRSHPYQVSIIVLIALTVALSPYILAAGILAILVGGYQFWPSLFSPFASGPLRRVEHQLESVQKSSRSSISTATRLLKQESNELSVQVDEVLRPIVNTGDRFAKSTQTITTFVKNKKQKIERNVKEVFSEASSVMGAVEEGTSNVAALARDATKCTQLPTKEMRSSCVEEVDKKRQSSN